MTARRFGLRQSSIFRPIDDFSQMEHNSTLGIDFKVAWAVCTAKGVIFWYEEDEEFVFMTSGRRRTMGLLASAQIWRQLSKRSARAFHSRVGLQPRRLERPNSASWWLGHSDAIVCPGLWTVSTLRSACCAPTTTTTTL